MRLSSFIAKKYNISRRYAKKAISDKKVHLDKKIILSDIEVGENANYEIDISENDINFSIDDYMIKICESVVFFYKPNFVHSERHKPEDKLCMSDIVKAFPGYQLISRLDYAVDGIMPAVNYTPIKINKYYLAWVEGIFPEKMEGKFSINAHKRKKVAAYQDLNGTQMIFKRLKNQNRHSLIEINIPVAARHQVRAVLAHINHPIVGDSLYNNKYNEINTKILLHCYKVIIDDKEAESPQNILTNFINTKI